MFFPVLYHAFSKFNKHSKGKIFRLLSDLILNPVHETHCEKSGSLRVTKELKWLGPVNALNKPTKPESTLTFGES